MTAYTLYRLFVKYTDIVITRKLMLIFNNMRITSIDDMLQSQSQF